MLAGIDLSVVCLALMVVPEPGLGVVKPASIACEDGIALAFNASQHEALLHITDARTARWRYAYRSEWFLGQQQSEIAGEQAEGSYKIEGDLVVFTGTNRAGPIRFALNYGKRSEHLAFNHFFISGKNELNYQRRWYRQVQGRWQPALEVQLCAPRTAVPEKGVWKLALRGSVRRWTPAGKESVSDIDTVVEYRKSESGGYHATGAGWLPQGLHPEILDDRLEGIILEGHGGGLRGFSPELFFPPKGE